LVGQEQPELIYFLIFLRRIDMQLTKRDREILGFINETGICVMPQIQREFNLKFPRSYQVMKRLIEGGYVLHDQIFRNQYGIYYLTSKGAENTTLPAISTVSLGGYKHQLLITDIRQKLCNKYPNTKWISERHLKQQKFYYGIGKTGHVADGMLIFPDKKIAIEVELSLKGKHRLESIFSAYGGQLDIEEAWYFCADQLIRPLTALSKNKSYIKIHSLGEFLYEQQF
jgi:predicted transcriptional regulator